MRAVTFERLGGAGAVKTVSRPKPDPDEVLIEVDRVQLSITECLVSRGEASAYVEAVRDRLQGGSTRLFGHEFCGRVVETGEDVSGLSVGDRVYPPGKIACNECSYCRNGYHEYCSDKETLGFHRPGALAEYVTAPEGMLCRLPDSVSDAEGAALQPLAASVLCVRDAQIVTGDVVAVIGAGIMGSQCGQIALQHGAAEVFAVDIDPKRLDIAASLGMTGIDARDRDPVKRIREATDGIGADIVFEAVGGEQAHGSDGDDPMAQAYRTARRGGTVIQVGVTTSEIELSPRSYRGRMISWLNPRDMVGTLSLGPNRGSGELAAELVETGRVVIEEHITHCFNGLERFESAIDVTLAKNEHDALGPAQLVLDGE